MSQPGMLKGSGAVRRQTLKPPSVCVCGKRSLHPVLFLSVLSAVPSNALIDRSGTLGTVPFLRFFVPPQPSTASP